MMKTVPVATFEVVHSLAKWKRKTLCSDYYGAGGGLYVPRKALRLKEDDLLGVSRSVGWEQEMGEGERSLDCLKSTLSQIHASSEVTKAGVNRAYDLTSLLPEQIHFGHRETLLVRYPDLDAKGRKRAIAN